GHTSKIAATRGYTRSGATDRSGMNHQIHTTKRRGLLAAAALSAALALAPAAAQAAIPSKLAYVTGLAGTRPVVHVANADGSGAVSVGNGVDALLSPDAANVAIVTPYTRKGPSLVVRPATGGGGRTLLQASQGIDTLAFSPDATRLLVVVNTTRLYVVT